jgi:hypothetical protein
MSRDLDLPTRPRPVARLDLRIRNHGAGATSTPRYSTFTTNTHLSAIQLWLTSLTSSELVGPKPTRAASNGDRSTSWTELKHQRPAAVRPVKLTFSLGGSQNTAERTSDNCRRGAILFSGANLRPCAARVYGIAPFVSPITHSPHPGKNSERVPGDSPSRTARAHPFKRTRWH